MVLADGSTQMHAIYTASVVWHGGRGAIRVYEAGDKPLIGMRMLSGSRVALDVVEGGAVTIEPLAAWHRSPPHHLLTSARYGLRT
ncbi:MAG: hypothetical protein OXE50_00095 [Chloroflexi bacterium]|nr:hypothetical protein [Chloroflexota bacterium]